MKYRLVERRNPLKPAEQEKINYKNVMMWQCDDSTVISTGASAEWRNPDPRNRFLDCARNDGGGGEASKQKGKPCKAVRAGKQKKT